MSNVNEQLLLSSETDSIDLDTVQVTANAWESIAAIPIQVEGRTSTWYQVKGHITNHNEPINDTPDYYIIFFNPTSEEWLKIVNPFYLDSIESKRYHILLNQLTQACKYGLKAANWCGVKQEACAKFRMVKVNVGNQELDAFVCPHLGPTIERYVKDGIATTKLISDTYAIAFRKAATLFLNTGIWMYDPNPGNILFHFTQDKKSIVTLIDFSNREQIRSREEGSLLQSLMELFELFRKHAKALKVDIEFNQNDFEELLKIRKIS